MSKKSSKGEITGISINYFSQIAVLTSLVCLLQTSLVRTQLDFAVGQKSSIVQQQRVGLAPNERPSCQLQSVYNRRQSHVTTTEKQQNQPQTNQEANINTILFQANNNETDSKQATHTILAPAVLSLQTTAANFDNNLVKGLTERKFDSSERLRQLRQLLISNNYDAYLVTPNDEHGSEYVTEYDRRLRFISGFTGSNGYALILLDRAVLFTDGRYQLQADEDLDCNWWLVVSDEPLVDINLWLKAQAARGIKVATDARLMSLQSFDYLDDQLRRLDSEFVLISQDLIDVVWDTNVASGEIPTRTSAKPEPIFVHPQHFNGNVSWQEKLVKLANEMSKLMAKHYVVSQLDDISWLLNLRGNDFPMAPLFKAYVFISRSIVEPTSNNAKAINNQVLAQNLKSPQVLQVPASQTIKLTLYVDLNKVDQLVRDHLHLDNGTIIVNLPPSDYQGQDQLVTTKILVELRDYQVFIMDLRDRLSPTSGVRQLQGRLLLNSGANVAIHVLAKAYEDRIVLVESLINKMKSVKTDSEVRGMRLAHWRDSLAISMLLSQLELDIGQMGLLEKWTEVKAAKELEFYRSLMDYNKGQSFDTISAYGSNAAIIHYQPKENLPQRYIGNESTYLLDSGGQYLDGTTDITRTTHYGPPTDFQRETYTRVLMGSIDTMSLIFDQSTRSPYRISDLVARRHLFEIGLDFQHGTGHGIGLFSLVHESPYLIENYATTTNAKRASNNPQGKQGAQILSEPVTLQANMFTSVEPGYYKANDFGIRLENIVVSQKVDLPSSLARPNDRQQEPTSSAIGRQFLRWEPISLVPFEPKLIKYELLSNKQKAWLNSYNLMVRYRMTKQINYYLNKIRNQQHKLVQVQGTALSSRLYQQMLSSVNATSSGLGKREQIVTDLLNQGQNNYLRMDGAKLQEKLELAHRWIMSKTEIIPLDVPQALVAPKSDNTVTDNQPTKNKHSLSGSSADKSATTSPDSSSNFYDLNQLMLVYMSSPPFNDREASEAIASANQLGARADDANATGKQSQQQPAIGTETGVESYAAKCTDFQCDLWLLKSLNHLGRQQRRSAAIGPRIDSSVRNGEPLSIWSEHQDLDSDDQINLLPSLGRKKDSYSTLSQSTSNFVSDLFKLGQTSANQVGVTINMWSILVIGLLVCIQIVVATYLCRGFGKSSRVQIAPSQPESLQLSNSN